MGFCKEFNEKTKNEVGLIIPVVYLFILTGLSHSLRRPRRHLYCLRKHARLRVDPAKQDSSQDFKRDLMQIAEENADLMQQTSKQLHA